MRRRVSQSHSLSTSFGPRSASGIKSKSTSKSFKDHPVKQLYLPQGLVSYVLSLPSQILFAILGMLGLAHYARQIVRVRPRSPGTVMLRANKAESNGTANSSAGAATETATGTGTETEAGTEEGGQVDVDAWIMRNTPSLSGSYTPSWWLPK
jgi:hypothetical protein